jgi:hypothetical protein
MGNFECEQNGKIAIARITHAKQKKKNRKDRINGSGVFAIITLSELKDSGGYIKPVLGMCASSPSNLFSQFCF